MHLPGRTAMAKKASLRNDSIDRFSQESEAKRGLKSLMNQNPVRAKRNAVVLQSGLLPLSSTLDIIRDYREIQINNEMNASKQPTVHDSASFSTTNKSILTVIPTQATGPLHSITSENKFQPIVMKRSFHIKQSHEMIQLQKKEKEL
jgi:hypothetical protein